MFIDMDIIVSLVREIWLGLSGLCVINFPMTLTIRDVYIYNIFGIKKYSGNIINYII
jgi:hypothetical protein